MKRRRNLVILCIACATLLCVVCAALVCIPIVFDECITSFSVAARAEGHPSSMLARMVSVATFWAMIVLVAVGGGLAIRNSLGQKRNGENRGPDISARK
jgi:hypothetical protein